MSATTMSGRHRRQMRRRQTLIALGSLMDLAGKRTYTAMTQQMTPVRRRSTRIAYVQAAQALTPQTPPNKP